MCAHMQKKEEPCVLSSGGVPGREGDIHVYVVTGILPRHYLLPQRRKEDEYSVCLMTCLCCFPQVFPPRLYWCVYDNLIHCLCPMTVLVELYSQTYMLLLF